MVAVQEIRWTGKGNNRSNNSTIFYNGTKNNRHVKGVGFVVNEKIKPCVKSFVAINEHIYFIHIVGRKFNVIVINWYAPTEEKEEEEKKIVYEVLERTFASLPKNCIIVIVKTHTFLPNSNFVFEIYIRLCLSIFFVMLDLWNIFILFLKLINYSRIIKIYNWKNIDIEYRL